MRCECGKCDGSALREVKCCSIVNPRNPGPFIELRARWTLPGFTTRFEVDDGLPLVIESSQERSPWCFTNRLRVMLLYYRQAARCAVGEGLLLPFHDKRSDRSGARLRSVSSRGTIRPSGASSVRAVGLDNQQRTRARFFSQDRPTPPARGDDDSPVLPVKGCASGQERPALDRLRQANPLPLNRWGRGVLDAVLAVAAETARLEVRCSIEHLFAGFQFLLELVHFKMLEQFDSVAAPFEGLDIMRERLVIWQSFVSPVSELVARLRLKKGLRFSHAPHSD